MLSRTTKAGQSKSECGEIELQMVNGECSRADKHSSGRAWVEGELCRGRSTFRE